MKSNFKSLDEIINNHIERKTSSHEIPMGSLSAVLTGQSQPFTNSMSQTKGVLQWGFSTWGVESVIGIDAPQNRK